LHTDSAIADVVSALGTAVWRNLDPKFVICTSALVACMDGAPAEQTFSDLCDRHPRLQILLSIFHSNVEEMHGFSSLRSNYTVSLLKELVSYLESVRTADRGTECSKLFVQLCRCSPCQALPSVWHPPTTLAER
jgi:hypothetical protein